MRIKSIFIILFSLMSFGIAQNGWHEISGLRDATYIEISRKYIDPYISIQNQGSLYFEANQPMYSFKYRIDSGSWKTVNLSAPQKIIGAVFESWPGTGSYTLEWDWQNGLGQHITNHCTINVVPEKLKRFEDNDGNTLDLWPGGSDSFDRPVIIVEGFDPKNDNYPLLYYAAASNFFNKLRSRDADVFVMNFVNGGQDIKMNADVVTNAVNYINSIKTGTQKLILAGLSMGGVVARYCLVDNEDKGTPLPVSHFLSLDAPQQGATINKRFQNYIRDHGDGVNESLNSMAAKQLLKYDTYDTQSLHDAFYNELNQKGLNGNGYPSFDGIVNIGATFSPNTPHTNNTGTWLKIKYVFGTWHPFSLQNGDPELDAGSFLPPNTGLAYAHLRLKWSTVGSLTIVSPRTGILAAFFNFLGLEFRTERDNTNAPTFIPYTSALDIVNGQSKFDQIVISEKMNFHDFFPDNNDVISGQYMPTRIADLLYLAENSTITVAFKNEIENSSTNVGGNLLVTDFDGINHTVVSGGGLNLYANKDNTAKTLDQKRLNWDNSANNYMHYDWNSEKSEYLLSHIFKGYENNGTETAIFKGLIPVTVKNVFGASNASGTIYFTDPWFVEPNGSQGGNSNGYNAPFTPGNGNFQDYGGVFLEQGYTGQNAVYYSVKALSSLDASAHGETVHYYFQYWDGTNVQYQSPDNLQTPVVFNAAGATAEARYKGHLASSTATATGPNGSRVVVRSRVKYDGYLYGSGKKYIYFMAYADGGEIWYSKAETDDQTTNGNFNWLTETKVSDGQGGNYNSSVATLGNIVYFTWAQKIGSTWYLRFRYYNNNNNSYYWSTTQTIASFTSTSTPTPQIALTENPVRVMVASNINGNVKTWLRKNGAWQYAGLNVSGSQPAICANNVDGGLLQPDYFGDVALVYTYNGDVYLRNWATSSENWSAAKKVSVQNMFSLGNNRASVSYGEGMAYISWVALNDEIGSHSIYERSWHASTNVFSSQTTVIEDPDDSSDPSVCFYESEYGTETIVYVNGGVVYKAKKTSSWSRTTIGAGRYPSITPYNNETLVYNKYNSAPYLIKHHYEAPAGGGGLNFKISQNTTMDSTVKMLSSRRLVYSFGDAALSVDLSNMHFSGQNLSWRADNHSDTLKAVTSGELTLNISTLQKNSIAADRPNETLFTIYFVSGKEETLLRSFRLSDMKPSAPDQRKGGTRHLLLASRRRRDGYFRIDFGANKPLEFTVLHASTDMQPLAKATEAAGSELSLPQSYSLGQNYPNPFNPVTHIRFALPEASDVTLTVYDMTGRAVSTLVNGYKSAGRYDVTFDGSGLASGEYIYRLEAGRNFIETKKLMLVK